MEVTDLGDRRRVAAPHAGRVQHAHLVGIGAGFERFEERGGTLDGASDGIAHPDCRGRRRGLPLLHDVEMGIEGRDFIGGRLRQAQFLAERLQMPRRNRVVAVLDKMQVFDEKIVASRPIAEKGANLRERL